VDLIGSPIKIPGLAEHAPSLPPALGEHSDNILQQILSATPTEIANWRTSGIIA
jgi:crotonobetainyl-CoA:carnitine CoA-transferase CaiB-like acyl-CoA transferase